MTFSDDILIRVAIFVLGVCGFLVARYIYTHKKARKSLVCPIRFDCNTVINSDYSKFLGIPVELLGMIYYALVTIAYFVFIFGGEVVPGPIIGIFITVSLGAFIFSLYLIVVQIFILRKGCSWCIVSSVISVTIFILTIFAYNFNSIAQIFTK
ncbi:hypothetical protein A3A03_02230 [Candidatus Nomurabacteria bacterium RIFCSPLOWO2_01_FULL_40_18]|uniref:Vitamin K epoxide reductase domain-containing protein n=1 Tax=Candidatus Nomurabacteria bacterium RIFCSPLOWO2_01_FULL_40_18 TaxID=1801773 RepID=A0A1F6XLT5_9BACT|nr:MAG: hypothetical protein A3A03_02230 [Candidatus Nomurabacteria bacterium RIFCSPLOWO2_01_FULL_40_18]